MTANPPPPAPGSPPPATARVRIEGVVTAVHADGRFTLALPDGTELAGTASGSQLRRLGRLIADHALVLGTAAVDGSLLVVDGVLPGNPRAGSGYQLSTSELAVLFANDLNRTTTGPEATDEEMDALMKDDR